MNKIKLGRPLYNGTSLMLRTSVSIDESLLTELRSIADEKYDGKVSVLIREACAREVARIKTNENRRNKSKR